MNVSRRGIHQTYNCKAGGNTSDFDTMKIMCRLSILVRQTHAMLLYMCQRRNYTLVIIILLIIVVVAAVEVVIIIEKRKYS